MSLCNPSKFCISDEAGEKDPVLSDILYPERDGFNLLGVGPLCVEQLSKRMVNLFQLTEIDSYTSLNCSACS